MHTPRIVMTLAALLAGCAHAPAGSEALQLDDVDQPPVLVACPEVPPSVPSDEWMRSIAVRFDVAADGRVVNAGPARPVQPGWEDTTAEAVRMVRSCRYTPALKDGQPVEVAGMWQLVPTDRRTVTTRSMP